MRGNPRDYDTWERMGNPGWGWDAVTKYFKKSEDNTDKSYKKVSRYHATGGLLKVGDFGNNDPMKKVFKAGFKELGFKEIQFSNANEFLGYFVAQATVDKGERCGTATAFLATAKKRKNLNVIKNAHVTNLEFDDSGAVSGVQFLLGNQKLKASAKKEVVVSAGVVGSPQLLMVSGIGPRAELQKHNIKVRKNLPVGLNLQDHINIPLGMAFYNSTTTASKPTDTADRMYEYEVHRKGYYTNIGGSDLMLFASTINDPKYGDIQINPLVFDRNHPDIQFLLTMFNLNDGVIKSFTSLSDNARIVIWCMILLTPKSRGHIDLASPSILDAPKIYPNYLHEKEDVDVLARGLQMLSQLSLTKVFSKQESQLVRINLPACDKFEYQSVKYWECYTRHMTISAYHHVGTCKMGPLNEAATVVDPELKVKGVKGLRVADASIMPKLVSGNTNAPTIMIGEKAADFIKKDWLPKG